MSEIDFGRELDAIKQLILWTQEITDRIDEEVRYAKAVPGTLQDLVLQRRAEFYHRLNLARSRYASLCQYSDQSDDRKKALQKSHLGVQRKRIEQTQRLWTLFEAEYSYYIENVARSPCSDEQPQHDPHWSQEIHAMEQEIDTVVDMYQGEQLAMATRKDEEHHGVRPRRQFAWKMVLLFFTGIAMVGISISIYFIITRK